MFSVAQVTMLLDSGELALSNLVEAVFVAQGYKVRSFPFGHDGSVEIIADGKVGPFGFILPQVAVLVNSNSELANPNVDELDGFLGRSGAWHGLFVSPTGFTKAAKKEAGRLFLQAIFWDLRRVIEALEENHEWLPAELKAVRVAMGLRGIGGM